MSRPSAASAASATPAAPAARRAFAWLALAAGLAGAGAQPAAATPVARARVEAVDAYLGRLEGFGFSGQVLIAERGRVVLERGYGFADRAAGRRMDAGTLFNVASFTKPITAIAVLQLEAAGRLRLSDSLPMHFADVPADKRAITIEQLLTHTAGFGHDALGRAGAANRDEGVRRILASRLRGRPGERYAYSNTGYQLLAALVERRTGLAFGDHLERHVFRPAGMRSSGTLAGRAWPERRVARGSNEWRELPPFTAWPRGWRPGSGDVVSRAADLLRLHAALERGRLLPPEAVARMRSGRVAAGDSSDYGYGWFVSRKSADAGMIGHGGDNAGYHAEFRWYPHRDRVVVLLTGQELDDENGVGVAVQKRVIANRIARILDGESIATPAPRRPDAALREALAGRYEGRDGARLVVWPDAGELRIGADGQAAIDALLGATPALAARCARANARARGILEAVSRADTAALRREVGPAVGFFGPLWRKDWDAWTDKLGAFRAFELCGTRAYPFLDDGLRTLARLEFERGTMDWAITWEGESLYETLTELGTPHAAIRPLAAVTAAGDTLATFDLVTHRGQTLVARREGGRVTAIELAGPGGREVFARAAR